MILLGPERPRFRTGNYQMRCEVCSDGDGGEKQTQYSEPHPVLEQKHLVL